MKTNILGLQVQESEVNCKRFKCLTLQFSSLLSKLRGYIGILEGNVFWFVNLKNYTMILIKIDWLLQRVWL
jgi:hypothetical protein